MGTRSSLVNVDARLIMQVVVNLVDNAIKYTPVGSVIQISAYRKDHQVVVDVADNGPGIPDRAKAQVFEMFYTGQSPHRRQPPQPWTGLAPLPSNPDGSRRNIDPA